MNYKQRHTLTRRFNGMYLHVMCRGERSEGGGATCAAVTLAGTYFGSLWFTSPASLRVGSRWGCATIRVKHGNITVGVFI
ncbi:MAG: hypothetical protein WAZ98_03825 [Cyclobacteriaceae bacterium]